MDQTWKGARANNHDVTRKHVCSDSECLEALMKTTAETNIFSNADVLVVTESRITTESYALREYYSFIVPAPKSVMVNRIAIFVKPHLDPQLIFRSTTNIAVWMKSYAILGCYFKPDT